jgi:hypothetical protein
MTLSEALADLRELLTALESKSMTIQENGEDVTEEEADRLRSNLEHLESAFRPQDTFPTQVGDLDPTKRAEPITVHHEPGIGQGPFNPSEPPITGME